MKKRILSLVLSVAMVIGLFAGLAVTANAAAVTSGFDAATPGTYNKVTDASTLSAGDEIIIVCESKGDAISTTQNKNNRGVVAVTISNDSVTLASGNTVQGIKLETGTNGFYLAVGTNIHLIGVSGNNYLKSDNSTSDDWTIAISGGDATITSGISSRIIKRNTSSDLYGTYTSGQTAVQIYKLDSGAPACTHENAAAVAAVAATCTTAGNIAYYYCADCGTYFTDSTLATTTTLAAVTIAATGHTWGSWNVTTAATCTAAGSQTRTCSVCQATETEAIPMTAHTYVNGVCSVCGAIEGVQAAGWYLVDDYTNLADGVYAIASPNYYAFNGTISSGHGQKTDAAFSFDANGYAATAPSGTLELTLTNTANGFTLYDATLGYLYASKASSGGLAFHAEETSGWSWSADGGLYAANNAHLRSYNDTFRTYAGNSNGTTHLVQKVESSCTHNWVAGTTVLPTCTVDGYTPYTCSLCGATKEDNVVPALGHLFGAATDNNNGTHTQTCSRCAETITSDCTFAVTEAGGNEFECSVCGYTKEVTQFYLNTTVADDDQVVIYHPTSGKALSATASGTKLAGVDVPADYYSTTKLCIPDGAVIMTVADYNNGQFHLTIDDNGSTLYLTSGATGNSLSFAAAPASGETDYGLWEIDTTTGLVLKNVNAAYNGNGQSLEYYNTFTTYGHNTTAAFQMELFTDAVPACAHTNTTLTGAYAATCLLPGYTGDYVCDDCGITVSMGSAIAALGHSFENGTCTNCGATQLTAVNVTSLTDGESVYIYNAGTALAMTSVTDVSGKFKGVPGSVSGNVLTTSSDATLFTVHVVTGGYKFEDPNGLYLTYGDDRNTLTLAADSTKAIWSLDASYHLIDVNSGYTYNGDPADLYLEAYDGYFTTYATSSLSAAFVLAFYDPNATDCTHVWDAGVENPAANCINTGVMTYTCTLCGATRTEVTPATGVHNYVDGVCTVCGAEDPNAADYSGDYYIAAIRSSGNYFWMTNTVASNRYTAEDSGLTTLPAEIDSNVDSGKVWTLTKQQDGTYILSTEGGYSNYTSGNVAVLNASEGKALTVVKDGSTYTLTFENEESGSTVTRYLSLNGTTNNDYFAYYKNTQRYNLSLVPVTGTVTPPASHTAVSHAAVAATCTTAGNVAYYTCSECETAGEGDHYGKYYSDATLETELSTIAIAALGHTLVYTDNGDGTHDATCSVCSTLVVDDEACTYSNGTCTLCGGTEIVVDPYLDDTLTFATINLQLESYIGADFFFLKTKVADYDSYFVRFTYPTADGSVTEDVQVEAYSKYYYGEHQVAAKEMADTIQATIYATKNGVTYHGPTTEWTLMNAMRTNMDKATATEAAKGLYVAILNYGEKAQYHFNYNTELLATSVLTAAEISAYLPESRAAVSVDATTSNGLTGVTFYKMALSCGPCTVLNVMFKPGTGVNISDVECHISYTNRAGVATEDVIDEFTPSGSRYVVLFQGMTAKQLGSTMQITFYSKTTGQPISETRTYSEESYIADNPATGTKAALFTALVQYADAAAAHFGS
ncbi:MAG: hypothetical protein IJJ99_04410 [Oscillospiraceae bacterium]|nr:hypothetical protein [Oscillospiraceae bacterium]